MIDYDKDLENLIEQIEDEWLARLPEDRPDLVAAIQEVLSK